MIPLGSLNFICISNKITKLPGIHLKSVYLSGLLCHANLGHPSYKEGIPTYPGAIKLALQHACRTLADFIRGSSQVHSDPHVFLPQ